VCMECTSNQGDSIDYLDPACIDYRDNTTRSSSEQPMSRIFLDWCARAGAAANPNRRNGFRDVGRSGLLAPRAESPLAYVAGM
jgi:hypothetical protein